MAGTVVERSRIFGSIQAITVLKEGSFRARVWTGRLEATPDENGLRVCDNLDPKRILGHDGVYDTHSTLRRYTFFGRGMSEDECEHFFSRRK